MKIEKGVAVGGCQCSDRLAVFVIKWNLARRLAALNATIFISLNACARYERWQDKDGVLLA